MADPLRRSDPEDEAPAAYSRAAPRPRRRSGYLEGPELDALEAVLRAALDELEARGAVRANDPQFDRIRLKLAAVILCEAGDGERDRDRLLAAAIAAVDGGPALRATL
jgi:hypothetical protein